MKAASWNKRKRFPCRTIEKKIEWLRKEGCKFPASRWDLLESYAGIGDGMMRELALRGMLVDCELWDGSLVPLVARALSGAGVTSRADFRGKYLAGELDMKGWRFFGKVAMAKALVWAGLPVPDDGRRSVTMTLDLMTCEAMDDLMKKRGLRRREELVVALVKQESERAGKSEREAMEEVKS